MAKQAGYMNKTQTAEYIGISERMIDLLRARGELKWVAVGTRVLFAQDEVDRFMSANTRAADSNGGAL